MNNLDKQYTDLLGDAYKKYLENHPKGYYTDQHEVGGLIFTGPSVWKDEEPHTQEEFINKIKTDEVFAKKWGFQVYTRELKHKERIKLAWSVFFPDGKNESVPDWWNVKGLSMDEKNIPTRAISLTYNTQTIEIYE